MKKTTVFAALICAFVCGMVLSSCNTPDPVSAAYGLGIRDYYSEVPGDLKKVEDYLASKGCANGDHYLIVDSSIEKCDQQATARFNEQIKNLSREEVAALGLHKDCHFSYTCTRRESPEDEPVLIGSWDYPAKN